MSGNVRVSWVLPTQRADGEALPVDQIDYVRIDARVDGIPEFSEVARVTPPELERLFPDLASGIWHFQGVVVDKAGREGPPRSGSVEIPTAVPGALATFNVSLA